MSDFDGEIRFVSQLVEFHRPEPHSRSSRAIGRDREFDAFGSNASRVVYSRVAARGTVSFLATWKLDLWVLTDE
jgi:hypothetical protein